MACTIKYKGITYTEAEFDQYVVENMEEFSEMVSSSLGREINSNKYAQPLSTEFSEGAEMFNEILDQIYNQISPETLAEVADNFGVPQGSPQHRDAVRRTMISDFFSNRTSELSQLASRAVVQSVSEISTKQTNDLEGLERKVYNKVTGQQTKYRPYPKLPKSQVAFMNEEGEWAVYDRNELKEKAASGEIDVESIDGLANFLSDEVIYEDKAQQSGDSALDPSLILNKSEKQELSKKLLKTLERLGFSTMRLSEYIESYRTKNGIDPSVEALADLTNRIVAIASGENTEGLLSEETAHILTETYKDQDTIREILPEVENTQEWADHADTYYNLYSNKNLTGEQLTEKVRREILGKIIAQKIQDTYTEVPQPQNIIDRVQNVVTKFFNSVRSYLKPSTRTRLDVITSRIADSINEEAKLDSMYSTDQLVSNPYMEFFSANAESVLTSQLNDLVRDSRKLLAKNKRGSLSSKVDYLATLVDSNTMDSSEALRAVGQYLDITNSVKRNVEVKVKTFTEAQRQGRTPKSFINSVDGATINILVTENLPHLQTVGASVRELEAPNYFTDAKVKEFNRAKERVSKQIDTMISDINALKGEAVLNSIISGEALLKEMITRYNLSPAAAQEIAEYQDVVSRDISILQSWFGNLQNAPNPILALLGRLIGEVYHKTDNATKYFSRRFLDKMTEIGIPADKMQSYFDKVIQKKDGKITGYLENTIDWAAFKEAEANNMIEAYNAANKIYIEEHNSRGRGLPMQHTPITELSQIGLTPEHPKSVSFSGNASKEYNRIINEWRDENLEQPYSVSFRQTRQDMFDFIENQGITLPDGTIVRNIPEQVPQMMGGWALNRRDIKAPYMKNGVLDYSRMSDTERAALDSIKRERLEAKSLVDPITGEKRTGEELEIALALQAIEQFYVQNNTNAGGKRTVKAEFIDALNSISDPQEAFEWFRQNAGITFNDNFWRKLDNASESSSNKFRRLLDSANMPSSEKDMLRMKIDELEDLLKRKTQYLKQFKNPTSPAEVDTQVMGMSAKDVYLSIENDIESLFSELNMVLKDATGSTVKNPLETESTANESFRRDFEEYMRLNPSGNIVTFGRKNSTDRGQRSIGSFNDGIKRFLATGDIIQNKGFRNNITRALGIPENSSTVQISNALNNYARKNGNLDALLEAHVISQVAGYYKRFSPKGFSNLYDQMKTGSVTDLQGNKYSLAEIATILREGNPNGVQFENNITDFIDLNAEVEWMEDESTMTKNPNYIETIEGQSNHYGGYGQPRFDKYKNTEFISKYNIDEQLYKTTGETKSRGNISNEDQKVLDLTEFLVHSRYNNLDQQGVASISNAYTLPGVRKASIDKLKDFGKNPINGTREWYKDFIDNSVDKKMYGESSTGEIDNDPMSVDRLVVPLLNVQPLEQVEDTSTDLFYSYTVHTYNANLYANRQEAMTEANQLESLLLNKDFKDKAVAGSNAHKAFQDFKKAYLLGVQETQKIKVGIGERKIDITNMLRTFDRALGTVNVGLNPVVSITAGTSALTFTTTEALVGEYTTPESLSRGTARFHSKASSFIGETGLIDKKNEIYLFGERFGIYNVLNGVENSGSSRFLRELFKDGVGGMPHIMTEFMTKPIAPSLMYATLDNFRFVEVKDEQTGQIEMEMMNYNQFREAFGKNRTKKELDTIWKSYEDNSVLNNTTVEDGMVKYSDRFKNEFFPGLTEEEFSQKIDGMEMDIRNLVSTLVSRADAKMPIYDKSRASRNALARFLLRHREWFTINFQNRFKRGHNNLYTGQYEEGHYITMAKYLGGVMKAFNPRNDTKLREIFETLTPTEKRSIKRVMIDSAISAVLIAFGSLVVSPWGDDEENKDNSTAQFMAYMYYRLASEQLSSGIAGVPAYYDVLETPFVAVNSVKQMIQPSNYSLDEVESGPYQGHSKLFKLAAKNTFARHYFDLVHGLKEKSDFYRMSNEWTLWGMQKQTKKEKEEQKKYEQELRDSYMNISEKYVR